MMLTGGLLMLGLMATPSALPLHLTGANGALSAQQGGHRLWSRPLRGDVKGPPYPATATGAGLSPLGIQGQVAYAVTCWDGSRTYCGTAGFDKTTGKPLFFVEGVPLAVGQRQMITNEIGNPGDTSFTQVVGTRIDLRTGRATKVRFTLPPRPGCGALNISLGLPGRTTYDERFVYAQQDDRCGSFVARFDWHGAGAQRPVIFGARSP